MFLKNKHVITALIIAPILSVISYFAVDHIVTERPHAAVVGQSYPLIARSNCRYKSGECDLVNASFKTKLTVKENGGDSTLMLTSELPLSQVNVGFSVNKTDEVVPVAMQPVNQDLKQWSLPLEKEPDETTRLHIAMTSNGTYYFAETNMAFSQYETIFNQDSIKLER